MLLIALAVWVVVHRWQKSGFQWAVFAAAFSHLQWRWLLASQLLVLLTYYGRCLRWEVMLRPLNPRPSMRNLFSATAIGFTAIVLFGRAGEMVRPYLISVKEKVPFSSQVAAWFLERIYDLLVVLGLFGFALWQMRGLEGKVGPALGWMLHFGGQVVGIASAACLLVLLFVRQFSNTALRRMREGLAFLPEKYFEKVDQLLTAFVQGLESTKSHTFVLLLVAYTLLEWAIIAGCYICIFRAFPQTAHFGIIDVLVFLGFVALGSSLQIPGIGGGMQVVSVLVLTELYGLGLEAASGVTLVVWMITWVVIVPVGLILSFTEGLQWSKLRRVERENVA